MIETHNFRAISFYINLFWADYYHSRVIKYEYCRDSDSASDIADTLSYDTIYFYTLNKRDPFKWNVLTSMISWSRTNSRVILPLMRVEVSKNLRFDSEYHFIKFPYSDTLYNEANEVK